MRRFERDSWVPDPVASRDGEADPERQALVGDAVGLALMVVLEELAPAERIAFVLHDSFGVPFEQVAAILGRSPAATRQLASRARRRVRDDAPTPDADPARQREAVDAFFAAARDGDFDALVAVLDPDVLLRSDGGAGRPDATAIVRGAMNVARRAVTYSRLHPYLRPALINGAAGVVVAPAGRPFSVMDHTVADGRVVRIDALADPERLSELDLAGVA